MSNKPRPPAKKSPSFLAAAFVHDDELGRWQTHAASMTVRLVLEQHWLRVQRRRRAQGFQVEHDESTAAGQQ